MKVCFIAGTLDRGGAERQLIYMLRALKLEGVAVRLLSLTRGEALESKIKDLGVDIEWVGQTKSRPGRAVKIIKSLKREPAEIVQSSHFYTNIYAGLAGRSLGIKSIGAIRNDLVSEIAGSGSYGGWQLRLPHHLIANTRAARDAAVNRGVSSAKIDFVQNVVDTNGNSGRNGRGADDVSILFVGRLVPQKQPEWFIRLAVKLISALPGRNLKFNMVGDGPLRQQLGHLAMHHGLSPDQFEFVGESADVGDMYDRSDILVLTSKHEGTPNVVLEAMAHRVPVVATSVGGVPEILASDRGFLVEPGDFDGLVDATRKLVLDCGLRHDMGSNGQKYTASRHALGDLGKQLVAIYSRLTGAAND